MLHFTHSGNKKPFLIGYKLPYWTNKSFHSNAEGSTNFVRIFVKRCITAFILTNSFTWAMGYCTVTKNRKLYITSGATINTPGYYGEGYKQLLRFFKGCVDQISQSSSQS